MIKMLKVLGIGLVLSTIFVGSLFAVQVNGYFKSNGTYVESYQRSAPNNTVTDNYSYKGNTNPYSGTIGTNKYQSSPSSNFFNGNSILNNNNSIFKGKSIFGN